MVKTHLSRTVITFSFFRLLVFRGPRDCSIVRSLSKRTSKQYENVLFRERRSRVPISFRKTPHSFFFFLCYGSRLHDHYPSARSRDERRGNYCWYDSFISYLSISCVSVRAKRKQKADFLGDSLRLSQTKNDPFSSSGFGSQSALQKTDASR